MKAPNGAYRLVKAFYCNEMSTVYHPFNTYNELGGIGAGLNVGQGGTGFKAYDFRFIAPTNGSTFGTSIYNGPWNSSSSLFEAGSSAAVVGAPICLSGGFSGIICNQIVRATGLSITCDPP